MFFFFQFLFVANGLNLEWSQLEADPYHSSSLAVQGNPPKPQAINFPTIPIPPKVSACRMKVGTLALTSSGRLIGSSYCPVDVTTPIFFFSYSETESWAHTDKGSFINQIVVSADGSTAIAQRDGFDQPFFMNVETGKFWPVKGSLNVSNPPIILCPETTSTFLLQNNREMNYVDAEADPELASTGTTFPGGPLTNTYMAVDPITPRVAAIAVERRFERRDGRLILWDVKVGGKNDIKLTQRWAYNFAAFANDKLSAPTFSKDGRVFIARSPNNFQVVLYILNGNTGGVLQHYNAESRAFTNRTELSITSDGKFALIRGAGETVVMSTSQGKFIRKNVTYTAIDEENSLAYGVNGCQLVSFCLQNPLVDQWRSIICDWGARASRIILGKYSGGQRRLFVGFERVANFTHIKVIEPPKAPQCSSNVTF